MFKIAQNEINPRKNNTTYKKLEVLPRDFEQKKCPTYFFTWRRKVGQRFKPQLMRIL
jgi:hypothetical protein